MKKEWLDQTNKKYHSTPALSSTGFKRIIESPREYKEKAIVIKPDNRRYGNLIHCAILEPKHFKPIMLPDIDLKSRKGKEHWESFFYEQAELGNMDSFNAVFPDSGCRDFVYEHIKEGVDAIRVQEYKQIKVIFRKIHEDPHIAKLLEGGDREKSAYWHIFGVDVKVRPDLINKEEKFILDVKTCHSLEGHQFEDAVTRFGYHIQARLYMLIAGIIDEVEYVDYYWLVVEKRPPFRLQLVKMPQGLMDEAWESLLTSIATYKYCSACDDWPEHLSSESKNIIKEFRQEILGPQNGTA